MTSLNPLAPVTDYQSMLNRIFWFTSASALVAIWMLRLHNPALNGLLSQIDFQVEFGGDKILPIPGGYLFPALAVGMLTRIYRLHARISDALGIRRCFDIDVIIAEFATLMDVDLSSVPYEQLVELRPSIMRTAFYPFVSGTRSVDRSAIDSSGARRLVVVLGWSRSHVRVYPGRLWAHCRRRIRGRTRNDRRCDRPRRDWPSRHARPMQPLRDCASAGNRRRSRPGGCRTAPHLPS